MKHQEDYESYYECHSCGKQFDEPRTKETDGYDVSQCPHCAGTEYKHVDALEAWQRDQEAKADAAYDRWKDER